MDDILKSDAASQRAALDQHQLRAEELMRATLERIDDVNGTLNAIVALRDPEVLLAEARAMDNRPRTGALHGLPIAVKELANVAGLLTTEGSPVFADRVARADDLHVARLRAAGAIIIGKTNAPEFGMGSQTFNPIYGRTRNPYDPALTCGGSSGGAAVALATRVVSIADGSDAMGSLRNPAGWTNTYGFRPSWGRIPRDPSGDAYLHQLATHGPMARSPADLALLMNVMCGPDPRVPARIPPQTFQADDDNIRGKRIGWLGDWGGAWAMEPGILELCRDALTVLANAGCDVVEIPPPMPRDVLWQSWATLRSWSVAMSLGPLAQDRDTRKHLKDPVIWEIERGLALSTLQIQEASERRSEWFRTAADLFDSFDALAAPTAQVWPFPVELPYPTEIAGQGMDTYHRWMEVVIPASLIGLPALAMPAGFGATGLPMGVQLIGRYGGDHGLLTLAQAYHRETQWPQRHPPEI